MPTKYLLPCTQCEQQVAVTAGQAGDRVRCECGTELHVPTMRGIRDLETEGGAESSSGAWGPRQGALLLGSVIAIAAAAAGIYQWTQMPVRPVASPEADLREELMRIDEMSASQSWVFWNLDVLQFQLAPLHRTKEFNYEAEARLVRPWMIFFFVLAVLGVVLAISSVFFPDTQ